jgi:RNA polymerase sigma factor for flagellar operon FliA
MLQYSTTKLYQEPRRAVTEDQTADRDSMIMAHLGKVRYIADQIAAKLPPSIGRDDLYGAGVIGLIDAIERYDVTRGVAFTTFAEMRVRGAILDNLRSLDWASRSARRRARDVQAAYARIEQQKGRAAKEEEVAGLLGISLADLQQMLLEISSLTLIDLDEPNDRTGLSLLETIRDGAVTPLQQIEESEQRRLLSKAIDKLPEREKQVIALYYLEELNMKEIGACLGVTESRVSQLRTQAVIRLRNSLGI